MTHVTQLDYSHRDVPLTNLLQLHHISLVLLCSKLMEWDKLLCGHVAMDHFHHALQMVLKWVLGQETDGQTCCVRSHGEGMIQGGGS